MKARKIHRKGAGQQATLLSEAQLHSLASAARREVFHTLGRIGPASVGEIAVALGQPADALYYHVRHLARAGLVAELGKRAASTRRESVYAVTTRLIRVDPSRRATRYLSAVRKLFESTLRSVARRIGAALDDPEVERSGPRRQVSLQTHLVRLDDVGLAELNRRIDGLSEFLAKRSLTDSGELYQVLTVTTTLRRGESEPEE